MCGGVGGEEGHTENGSRARNRAQARGSQAQWVLEGSRRRLLTLEFESRQVRGGTLPQLPCQAGPSDQV